jgi:hypothetical protein
MIVTVGLFVAVAVGGMRVAVAVGRGGDVAVEVGGET